MRRPKVVECDGTRRRRFARALAELHRALRTEGSRPGETGIAVGVGCFVGCVPIYGLHLAICTAVASLLRVSRLKTYLAAHVNNPLTAPLLLFLEVGVGRRITQGQWPSLADLAPRRLEVFPLGRDLLLGSLVVGAGVGVVAGLVAFAMASRWRRASSFDRLIEEAAGPYLGCGIVHWEFVRGKLRYDPVYRAILESEWIPRTGWLADVGCGRGALLSLVDAGRHGSPGDDGADLTVRPGRLRLFGVDHDAKAVRVARQALGARAEVVEGDAARVDLPPCNAVTVLDVLHYLPGEDQEPLLCRCAEALEPGGVLLVREADAAAGARFHLTRLAERLRAIARGHPGQRFRYQEVERLRRYLAKLGLEVETQPMAGGTPFANRLLVGRRPVKSAAKTAPSAEDHPPADKC